MNRNFSPVYVGHSHFNFCVFVHFVCFTQFQFAACSVYFRKASFTNNFCINCFISFIPKLALQNIAKLFIVFLIFIKSFLSLVLGFLLLITFNTVVCFYLQVLQYQVLYNPVYSCLVKLAHYRDFQIGIRGRVKSPVGEEKLCWGTFFKTKTTFYKY